MLKTEDSLLLEVPLVIGLVFDLPDLCLLTPLRPMQCTFIEQSINL
jgi:hypothetical protein